MGTRTLKVLLIGETPQGSSYLAKRLEGRACECNFATSQQQALWLLGTQSYDLVFSPVRMGDASLFSLIDLLEGSCVTLFYSQAVEDGCWWLPALLQGERCFGSSAFRPSEFVSALDDAIEQIRFGGKAEGGAGPVPEHPTEISDSVVQFPLRESVAARPSRSSASGPAKRKVAG